MGRKNQTGRTVHGILLLDKAQGCSSNHALQRIKRLYDAKKAGHTGSLDPLATGMLPICFGEATKVSSFLLNASKTYLVTARLGVVTDTADADGKVLAKVPVTASLTEEKINTAVAAFIGEIEQVPPMYSAIRIGGQRLYKLARRGEVVERPARSVMIYSIELLDFDQDRFTLRVHCSKGTYIRTLVEDLGSALDVGAHVTALRREQVDPFGQSPMKTEAELQASLLTHGMPELDSYLLGIDCVLGHLLSVNVTASAAIAFRQGQAVASSQPLNPAGSAARHSTRVYCDGRLLGLGAPVDGVSDRVRPVKVFNW